MTSSAYLDYNATAPMRPEAKAAMMAACDLTGNASSVHRFGREARAVVEDARAKIAGAINAKPSQVIFTSGATEANCWVAMAGWDAFCLAPVEHDSLYAPVQKHVPAVTEIGVDSNGVARIEQVAKWALCQSSDMAPRRAVSLQIANNETGALQPVAELAEFAREHGIFCHSDAVQGVGRVAVDFTALGLAALSLSAHKFGGPKGIGALVLADDAELPAMIIGGGQERRRRSGTENVAAIAGFGAAITAAVGDLDRVADLALKRGRLEAQLKAREPELVVLSAGAERLANTSCFAVPGKRAETLLIQLDLAGVAVSSGAACSSGKVGVSRTVQAMAGDARWIDGVIRVSIGHETTDADINHFVEVWQRLNQRKQVAA